MTSTAFALAVSHIPPIPCDDELEAPLLLKIERPNSSELYPSLDFPALDPQDMYLKCLVPVNLLKTWEKERDACQDGNHSECCWRGTVSRLQYLGNFVCLTPKHALYSIAELIWSATCCGVGTLSTSFSLLSCVFSCGHSGQVTKKTSEAAIGAFKSSLGCLGMSALSLGQIAWTAIRLPCNLIAPECMHGCLKQHKVDLCCAVANQNLNNYIKESEDYFNV